MNAITSQVSIFECEQCELEVKSVDGEGICAKCNEDARIAIREHVIGQHTEYLAECIQIAKDEVIADIINGDVPKSVKSFSELHDYVDANTYGTICEDECRAKFETSDEWFAFGDEVFSAIDAWIKSGELKAELKAKQAK